MTFIRKTLAVAALCAVSASAVAQSKPPVAQAWIDVATFSGFGMPAGGAGGSMMGALFGGGSQSKLVFPATQTGSGGAYLDVTLANRNKPQLDKGVHNLPAGAQLGPQLNLLAPQNARSATDDREDVMPYSDEKPKGRISLYWGCGDTVRAGQPRVIDMSRLNPQEIASVFVARRATQRGVHSASGRPHWPNANEGKALPGGASLVGEHRFTADGLPPDFAFQVAAANDVMPALNFKTKVEGQGTALEWNALPTATGYFANALAAKSDQDIVIWSSSELADTGFGLLDYQTNSAVDRWVKERVVLSPATSKCKVPAGILPAEGAMLRLIAYGPEMNLAFPPRPSNANAGWEPQWAVKLRLKSVATQIAGMPSMGEAMTGQGRGDSAPGAGSAESSGSPKMPGAVDVFRGLFGR